MTEFAVQRSRAIAPLFLRAPHPPNMVARDYQHAGVEYAASRRNCLIGDAPGVGKTAEAIMLSNLIEANRTLVICPASLRLNWQVEIWRWSTIRNVTTKVVVSGRNGISDEHNYLIISYDLLRNMSLLKAILAIRWDHMILDEAHALKDPKGNRRTHLICGPTIEDDEGVVHPGLPAIVGRITCLTGTPTPNQPSEVYNSARLLNWDCIDRMSYEAFREYYYAKGGGMVRSRVWDAKIQANVYKLHYSEEVRNIPRREPELQARLRGSIMVRRLKADVLAELPEKQYAFVPLAIDRDIQTALKHPGWGRAANLYDADQDGFAHDVEIDGEISTARRMLGEAKVRPVLAHIHDLMAEVDKLIVSAHHTTVLKKLLEGLQKYRPAFMDGRTSGVNRQAASLRFQNEPDCRIILGQTGVIGEGWTLTAAQDVYLVEPDWVPGKIEQVGDRAHRYGQQGNYVRVHIPIIPGSLDERVVARAVEKAVSIHKALDA